MMSYIFACRHNALTVLKSKLDSEFDRAGQSGTSQFPAHSRSDL